MLQYLIRRLLIFIPMLFVISLIAFWLSKLAPGDPIPLSEEVEKVDEVSKDIARQMGLDKPVFYFNFTSAAYPDTLYKITERYKREARKKLVAQYGNWPLIQDYSEQLYRLRIKVQQLPDTINRDSIIILKRTLKDLSLAYKDRRIKALLTSIHTTTFSSGDEITPIASLIGKEVEALEKSYQKVITEPSRHLLYLPAIRWQGFDNQYHNWVTAFMTGDFGTSYLTGQKVADRLKTPIFWTLTMNLMSIFIAYLISIPLGVYAAVKKNTLFDKMTTVGLFILYALPSFWIGTLLIVFFTNPEYGMDWFAGPGLGSLPADAPFWNRFWETASHLVLPVFCITYSALAFISRQVRGSVLDTLQKDFVRTAMSKGLSKRKVIWKHTFRNALFPLITLFAVVLPGAIAGSVVIEVIFNIPGMGRTVVDAIFQRDWQVVYTILLLVAILTMLGNLLADFLYALADPRVSYSKN